MPDDKSTLLEQTLLKQTLLKKLFSYPLEAYITVVALLGIISSLILRYGLDYPLKVYEFPLLITLILGGAPLVFELLVKLFKKQFGSDLLAGISIVTAVLLDQYLAGAIVVLMLSGGETLEEYAVGRASSALNALAKRMPTVAHKKIDTGNVIDVKLAEIQIGDSIIVYPHEICPVDGIVTSGRGVMDESYLTGEPFEMSKTPGSEVISGAVNGESAITIKATKLTEDSRYAKIMQVMRESEESRPQLRRLGDQLGAWYTPLAVAIAIAAWYFSGDPVRFLATLVIATPCPLLIAIPTAIIGAVSVAARRAIVIRDPSALEQLDECRTIILDKTGTMTFGRPKLTDEMYVNPAERARVLAYAASIERYSKHPLAAPIRDAIDMARLPLLEVSEVHERPGEGMRGIVNGHKVEITGRSILKNQNRLQDIELPPTGTGLECIVIIDDKYAATYRFHDAPREGSRSFVEHLCQKHKYNKVMMVSGDREAEVRYLADQVGITDVHAEKSPEEKVAIVKVETALQKTLFIGDGINDAPAMTSATIGIAFGATSDVTAEAAQIVVMESSLRRVDELFHIGARLRKIALQSAFGGMALSVIGMFFAAFGYLPPVAGAIGQEIIDLFAVLNALRMAFTPKELTDY